MCVRVCLSLRDVTPLADKYTHMVIHDIVWESNMWLYINMNKLVTEKVRKDRKSILKLHRNGYRNAPIPYFHTIMIHLDLREKY